MSADFKVLVTAEEAWPAFEQAVLNARHEMIAGFRIFDMRTRLRSAAARAVGRDWFDLLAHALERGVTIHLIVSDFDPVIATPLHQQAWRTVRQGAALREITGAGAEQLKVRAALHPAKAGGLPWLAFLPAVLRRRRASIAARRDAELSREAVLLNDQSLPDLHTVTHHQKLAVIDSQTLYVGGLDLNERRFDTLKHDRNAAETWSDVQLLIKGPEARDARQHLHEFEAVCAGKTAPTHLRHIQRTLSAPRRFQLPFLSPRPVLSEIEAAHLAAFGRARHLIYVETQYLRANRLAEALAKRAAQLPDLTAVIILPALPEELAFDGSTGLDVKYGIALQQRALTTLRNAFGKRLTLATPVRPVMAARQTPRTLAGSPIIHVHNKVLIQDDRYALIGSANLNGRSLRWDSEVAIETTDPGRLGQIRDRLFQHWWFAPLPATAKQPQGLQSWWARAIARNTVKQPEKRTGFLVDHDPGNMASLANPLPGVTEDIV